MTSPPGVRIRRARLPDAAAIAAVMRTSVRGLARNAHGPREIALWSSLPPLYHAWAMTAGGEVYLVAERRARIVAYAALRGREVTAVFVRPAHAGRGIGLALLGAVERLARRRGVRGLFARAALGAVGFYERAGYRRARALRVPLFGGASLRAVRVEKGILASGARRVVAPTGRGGPVEGRAATPLAAISARGRASRSSRPRPRRRRGTRPRRWGAS